ncbi:MAG: iron-containing alcohol dehydrogenase [Eubacteriales bacterium]
MQLDYYIPTKILFGAGKLSRLATEKLPGSKALIVISQGASMKKNGYLERVQALLRENNTESVVFDKILPNPIHSNVMEGAALAKKENCDFILGLGGGSSIDSAKSIAVMVTNPGEYWDYISGGSGGGKPVQNKPLPVVAITTTAGTGTEADPWTVITKGTEKIGFGMLPETMPVLSIVDPELMTTVPPKLTAYQGFDALFHATEGYMALIANPVSDLYALKSISLVFKSLAKAVWDGNDLEARTDIALANTLSGMVESTSGCTSEHSMEHALSAYHNELPHGAGLIMLSEAYHTFFADKVPERFADMARAAGDQVDSLPEGERAMAFVHALLDLQKKCGVDELKMSDYGIKKSDIPALAKNARETMGGLFACDPYQLSQDEVEAIYAKAYQ